MIGTFFLVIGRLRLLQRYKIQQDDHVPWNKLPKVERIFLHFKKYLKIFPSILDIVQYFDKSGCRWRYLFKVHFLFDRTCEKVQNTRKL